MTPAARAGALAFVISELVKEAEPGADTVTVFTIDSIPR